MGDRDDAMLEKCLLGGGKVFVPTLLPISSGRVHVATCGQKLRNAQSGTLV